MCSRMRATLLLLQLLAVATHVSPQPRVPGGQAHGVNLSPPLHFKMTKKLKPSSQQQQMTTERDVKKTPSESHSQEKDSLRRPFSSFSCSGGTQDTHGWFMRMHENISVAANRVCLFRNICYMQGKLVYYRHPEERRAPASTKLLETNTEYLKVSFLEYKPSFSVVIRDEARPQHLLHIDNKTWFFSLASYAFNFAHLLIDDLYPMLAALNVFNLGHTQPAVVFSGCSTTFKNYTNYYDEDEDAARGRRTVPELCEDNYRLYSKLLFGEEAVEWASWADEEFCFERFVAGQGHAYGRRGLYGHPDNQRAMVLRQGRDAIVSRLQAPDLPRSSRLKVLVIPKDNPGYLDDIFWSTMCADVTAVVSEVVSKEGEVDVECMPRGLSVEEEIALIRSSTLLVAVHGTLSLLSLFARDGSVLISVGGAGAQSTEGFKELDYLPYATHVQVLFHEFEEGHRQRGGADFPGLVRYALHLSAENLQHSLSD